MPRAVSTGLTALLLSVILIGGGSLVVLVHVLGLHFTFSAAKDPSHQVFDVNTPYNWVWALMGIAVGVIFLALFISTAKKRGLRDALLDDF